MNETLLDTQALVWLLNDNANLSQESRRMAMAALAENSLAVSSFTSWEIAILSQELDRGFPADPADRIIVATAIARRATLVTTDAAILQWPGELRRHDARG